MKALKLITYWNAQISKKKNTIETRWNFYTESGCIITHIKYQKSRSIKCSQLIQELKRANYDFMRNLFCSFEFGTSSIFTESILPL